MQIEAIFVGALLATQEELAKFRCSKACSDQALVVHMLINWKNSNGTISWISKCHVRRIARTTPATGINIVGVDNNLFNFSVLPKQIQAPERAFLRYIRCQSNDIHQCFLYNSQIRKSLHLLSWQLTNHNSIGRRPRRVTKLLHRFDTDINQCLPAPAVYALNLATLQIICFILIIFTITVGNSFVLLVVLIHVIQEAVLTDVVLTTFLTFILLAFL